MTSPFDEMPPAPTLSEQLEAARQNVARLEREVAAANCAEVGHRWKCLGGRNAGCDLEGRDCHCSVPVHECEVCGDCDYGENAVAQEVFRACTEQMILDDREHENRACTICGARTDDEAGKVCRSYQLPSGEYTCNGHPEETNYPDGRLRFISEVGVAKINEWVDAEVARMKTEGEEPKP